MTSPVQSQPLAPNAVKFRPSLSAAQIQYLLDVLQHPSMSANVNEMHDTTIHSSCIKSLAVFALKAQHGIVSPSHVTTGRPDIMDTLGFIHHADGLSSQPEQPVADKNKLLYDVWCKSPATLSATQLAAVQLYRYQNDLMTPEEEAAYEASSSHAMGE